MSTSTSQPTTTQPSSQPSQQSQRYHPPRQTLPPPPPQSSQQSGYYIPSSQQQRAYPIQQYHTHPTNIPHGMIRYDSRYDTNRMEYPDDDFYSDVDYDDGIDDGYYDAEEPNMTKESEKPLSWVWLYVIGLLTCLTIEIITIILAYFLDIVIVAPLLCSLWFFFTILSFCTLSSIPSRTSIITTFILSCIVAIVCGLIASAYLKIAWYYDGGNYYQQINPTLPSSNYPNAVTASFSHGSYVGKDYTGMISSNGHHYCVAPILGISHDPIITTTFWAMDMDCCMTTNVGVTTPGHIIATCQQWGNTVLEGEIHKNPSDGYISAVFASLSWYETLGITSPDDRYYIEILPPGEHGHRQQKRRLIGYLILGIAPICWPVILIFYVIWKVCMNVCCGKKQTTTTTTY